MKQNQSTSSVDYVLISCASPEIKEIAFLFGLYERSGVHNGRPAYKQLQSECQGNQTFNLSLYCCNDGWAVGPTLGGSPGFLFNFSKSRAVPTSGWLNGIGCGIKSTITITATPISDLSTILCSTITITAKGAAARLRQECLGTYSHTPGKFNVGRQIFRNNTTDKILSFNGGGFWNSSSDRIYLRSGSRCNLGMCPADTKANNEENWNYKDSEGIMQESSDIIITCATHSASITSSAQEIHLPNIDDVMKYIEGEPSHKPKTKSKKKKKSKAKSSHSKDSTAAGFSNCNIGNENVVAEETETGPGAVGAVGGGNTLGNLDIIKETAKSKLEDKLRKLNKLELNRKEIEAKISRNEEDFQNHVKMKKESTEQQRNSMADCLMAISEKKILMGNIHLEMETLVKQMNYLKAKSENIADDLKMLEKKKTNMEKCTEKTEIALQSKEEEIKTELRNLQNALEANQKATENLTTDEVTNTNTLSISNKRILEILSKTIQEKEKFIQEKERDLECPVCLDTAQVPIYMCEEQHAICSSCRMNDKVDKCPLCRVQYFGKPRRHRYAEKNLEDLIKLREELSRLTEERSQLSTDNG